MKRVKVLCVCLGNICRSPTAEAVLRAKAKQANIELDVDSAGTINHHQGCTPDTRACYAAQARGYSFAGITSRPICVNDFHKFDYILAADNSNIRELKAICPAQLQHKISLFLAHGQDDRQEIPDPYYGGEDGFNLVLDLVEQAAEHFLHSLTQTKTPDRE